MIIFVRRLQVGTWGWLILFGDGLNFRTGLLPPPFCHFHHEGHGEEIFFMSIVVAHNSNQRFIRIISDCVFLSSCKVFCQNTGHVSSTCTDLFVSSVNLEMSTKT